MSSEPVNPQTPDATWTAASETAALTPHGDLAVTGPAGEGDHVPQRLGSVRLLRPLGRGGMGVVWLGRDEMLERDVAVKFLLNAQASASDPEFAVFLQGARAAAKVRHPGLTTLFHADLFEGRPSLVMEYVNGPALNQVLRQSGPLSLPVVLGVLQTVCDAVGELHEQAIVHRDVKPGNVLLDMQGRVFVTDFGLACARPTGSPGTSVAAIAGTPAYMAPEMFDGVVSPRSDVYALGATAFELLAGELPFTGSFQQLREQHRSGAPPLERLAARGVPAEVAEVIGRALHKDAMFRYKTARHLLRALHEATANEAVWTRGAAELGSIAARTLESRDDQAHTGQTPRVGSSYYDLIATRADERRRQQGKPVPGELAPSQDRPGPAPTVQADVPCAACDYNLRGLAADGRCPECGTVISDSLRRERLIFADPGWLAKLATAVSWKGSRVLKWASYTMYFSILVKLVFAALGVQTASWAVLPHVLLLAGFVVCWSVTFGRLTLAEPGGQPAGRAAWLRGVARLVLVVPAYLFVGAYLEQFVGAAFLPLPSGNIAIVVTFACFAVLFCHLRGLAVRVPHRRLVRRTDGQEVLFLIAVVALLLWPFPSTRPSSWWPLVSMVAFVAALLCGALLWVDYSRALLRACTQAVRYETLFGAAR